MGYDLPTGKPYNFYNYPSLSLNLIFNNTINHHHRYCTEIRQRRTTNGKT